MRTDATLLALVASLVVVSPAVAAGPQVTDARLALPAIVGQESVLAVTASDPDRPVAGFAVAFGDGVDRIAGSACRLSSAGATETPFAPGSPSSVEVPHRFGAATPTTVTVQVTAGDCVSAGGRLTQPYTVTPARPGEPAPPLVPGVPEIIAALGTPKAGSGVFPTLPKLPGVRRRAQAGAVAVCKGAREAPAADNLPLMRRATLCLVNRERTRRGLKPLHTDKRLAKAARLHSKAMVRHGFFAHVTPAGTTVAQRIRKTGYLARPRSWRVGENLATGSGALATPHALVKAWMKSTGHRANILDRGFTDLGLGAVIGMPGGGGPPAVTLTTNFGQRRLR